MASALTLAVWGGLCYVWGHWRGFSKGEHYAALTDAERDWRPPFLP